MHGTRRQTSIGNTRSPENRKNAKKSIKLVDLSHILLSLSKFLQTLIKKGRGKWPCEALATALSN